MQMSEEHGHLQNFFAWRMRVQESFTLKYIFLVEFENHRLLTSVGKGLREAYAHRTTYSAPPIIINT